jgi:YcxB-like protein
MAVEYTLNADDITSARLLAIGIRPRLEFALFASSVAVLLAWSVSPWRITILPLLIGLTASLGAFRLMQIGKVKEAAVAAFRRNPTLRLPTTAEWDERGVTIQPAGALTERILWTELQRLRENERVILLLQGAGFGHAIPKRAFPNKTMLDAFRVAARAGHRPPAAGNR